MTVVSILSALWWMKIRGLWKLPDGRDWLWGNLNLALMGGAWVTSCLPWEQELWLQQTWEVSGVSPTTEPPSRQPTSRRTVNTNEVFALLRKFWDPHQISQPGDLAKGLRTPREFDFEGQWDLIAELPQDWEYRLLEGTKKTFCALGPRGKEQ